MNDPSHRFGDRRRALILVAALLAPCLAAKAASAANVEVTIDNFSFQPDKLAVKAGTTIVFRNRDDIPHVVAEAGGAFHSEALDTDDTFSYTFDRPGQFSYFCSLHPKMTGKIIVTP